MTITFTRNPGIILLAIFLILYAIGAIFGIAMPAILLGALAGLAGIFLLISG